MPYPVCERKTALWLKLIDDIFKMEAPDGVVHSPLTPPKKHGTPSRISRVAGAAEYLAVLAPQNLLLLGGERIMCRSG